MSHEKKMSWSDLEDDSSFDVSSSSYTESDDRRYWRYLEPPWDGSKVINEASKATEQNKTKDSTTEETEEDTDPKTSEQQRMTKAGDQLTLQTLSRSITNDLEAM